MSFESGSSSTSHDRLSSSGTTASSSSYQYQEKSRRSDVESGSEGDASEYDELDSASESHALLGLLSLPIPRKWKSRVPSLPTLDVTAKKPYGPAGTPQAISLAKLSAAFTILALLGTGYLLVSDCFSLFDQSSTAYDIAGDGATITTPQPTWAKAAVVLEDDPTHVLVPPPQHDPTRLLQSLRDRLPYAVLEEYYTTGRLPASYRDDTAHQLDLVYLYVNASSPYLQQAMDDKAAIEGVHTAGKKRHWRDNGELRGAVRSGIRGLGKAVGNVHLVSADWDLTEENRQQLDTNVAESLSDDGEGWRIGQIPEWLDWDSQREQGRLRWHFHNDIFRLPAKADKTIPLRNASEGATTVSYWDFDQEKVVDVDVAVEWADEAQWRSQALPNFNSFAIESRLGWVPGLSENFIASNDDMFVLSQRNLSVSDFRHPLLGNIVRLDPGLLVTPSVEPYQINDSGEWGALQHANVILSRRFFKKKRMYMHHLPKTVSRALVDEASIMFADELSLAATRGFRESRRGAGDVEMAWLTTHLRVERWREALLWTWAVGKLGGVDGFWGPNAREELRQVLRLTEKENATGMAFVSRGPRKTLDDLEEVQSQAGWDGPEASTYYFSSFDGHLPDQPNQDGYAEHNMCTFKFSECLPAGFFSFPDQTHSATAMFAHLAFANPSCGDCLINALVRSSGERGLSAFLPHTDVTVAPDAPPSLNDWETSEPMLPLVHDWTEADFSVAAIVKPGQEVFPGETASADGSVSLRKWCIKLLSRYNYVLGGTPSLFVQIHSSTQMLNTLDQLDTSPDLALFCMNDDQQDATGRRAQQARVAFGKWMQGRWGEGQVHAPWERDGVLWYDEDSVEDEAEYQVATYELPAPPAPYTPEPTPAPSAEQGQSGGQSSRVIDASDVAHVDWDYIGRHGQPDADW
ncbi:hypothetical protein IAU60_001710 [Kwoniella sp. DSM 27419]